MSNGKKWILMEITQLKLIFQQISHFKNLGCNIRSRSYLDKKEEGKEEEANTFITLCWTSKEPLKYGEIIKHTKMKIYEPISVPTSLCGSESR